VGSMQSHRNPQKAPVCAETRHTSYRSLSSVHPFLHSYPFYRSPQILCFAKDTPLKVPLTVGACAPSCSTMQYMVLGTTGLVGWLEFNVRFEHKYGYIRDDWNHKTQPLIYNGLSLFPKNCPFAIRMGDLDLYLIHSSLGSPESTTQTTYPSVQRILQGSQS